MAFKNMVRAGAGGLLFGSLVGLSEAIGLDITATPPDRWAFLYGWILYGILGCGFGVGIGILFPLTHRWLQVSPARAFAIGGIGAIAPLLLVILRYIANKDIYQERGIPLGGSLAIFGFIALICLVVLIIFPVVLRALFFLLRPLGFTISWIFIAVSLYLVGTASTSQDPRAGWEHQKPIPPLLKDRPNTLVIFVDTLRSDYLDLDGARGRLTPNLEQLARDSVVFENAYSNASWTRASGASLLTSRLPSGHGAALKSSRLGPEVTTWAEVMSAAGVTTGALVNNINLTSTFGFNQGFDIFFYEAPAYRLGGTESVFGLSMYKVLLKVAERLDSTENVEQYYQPASVVLGDARRFIDDNPTSRWSLLVHLMEPHDPYFEHPSIMGTGRDDYNGIAYGRGKHERPDPAMTAQLQQLYQGEIQFLDRELGTFFNELKAADLYDDLFIVVLSDHGEEFGEHGGFWHGNTLYEEQIHVPLIVKLPKQSMAGTRVPWSVHSLDIAPTLTTAMGLSPDSSWQGRDLLSEVRTWTEASHIELAPVVEAPVGESAPIPPPPSPKEVPIIDACFPHWPYSRVVVAEQDFEGNQISAIQKDGWKWIRVNEGNRRDLPTASLFHLTEDKSEQRNLAGLKTEICGSTPEILTQRLNQELSLIVESAAKTGATGEKVKMDAVECERLQALGYLSSDEPCGE